MIWFLAIVGGLLNRARGSGVVPIGHQKKRIIFALATGALCHYLGAPWLWSVVCALGFWLGLLKGWGQWMDLGRFGGARLGEFCLLSLRGLWLTGLAGGPLVYAIGPQFWPFALSGLSMGVLYEIAWRIPSNIPQFEAGPPIGEVLFGTFIWLMILVGAAP